MARLLFGDGLRDSEVPRSVLSPAVLVLEQNLDQNAERIKQLSLTDLARIDAAHMGAGADSPAVLYNFGTWKRKLEHLFVSDRTKARVTQEIEKKQEKAKRKEKRRKKKKKEEEGEEAKSKDAVKVTLEPSIPAIGDDLEVRRSRVDDRRGLFAKREFKNKDTVAQFGGELIDEAEVAKRFERDAGAWIRVIRKHKLYQDAYSIQGNFNDPGTPAASFARVVTDRKDANAKLYRIEEKGGDKGLALRAFKLIRPGDEVRVLYVPLYWHTSSEIEAQEEEKQTQRIRKAEKSSVERLPKKFLFKCATKRELRRQLSFVLQACEAVFWIDTRDTNTLHATRFVYDEDTETTLIAAVDLNNGLEYDFDESSVLFVRFSSFLTQSTYVSYTEFDQESLEVHILFDVSDSKMLVFYPEREDELTGGEDYDFVRVSADEYLSTNALNKSVPPPFSTATDTPFPHFAYQVRERDATRIDLHQTDLVPSGKVPLRELKPYIEKYVDARVRNQNYPCLPFSEDGEWPVKASIDKSTRMVWVRQQFSDPLQVYFKASERELERERDLLKWDSQDNVPHDLFKEDSLDATLMDIVSEEGKVADQEEEQEQGETGLFLNAQVELPISAAVQENLLDFCGGNGVASDRSPVAWSSTTLQRKAKGMRSEAVELILKRLARRQRKESVRRYVLYTLVSVSDLNLAGKSTEELGFEVVHTEGDTTDVQLIRDLSAQHRTPALVYGFMVVALDIQLSSLAGPRTEIGAAVIELICLPEDGAEESLELFKPFMTDLNERYKMNRVRVTLQDNLSIIDDFVSVLGFSKSARKKKQDDGTVKLELNFAK